MTSDKVIPLHPPKSDNYDQWQQLEAIHTRLIEINEDRMIGLADLTEQRKQIKEQLLKILETKPK